MGAKKRKEPITLAEDTRDYFLDRTMTESNQVRFSNDGGRSRWRAHADELTAEYAKQNPGRRPYAWWKWTAPEPRKRLGGIGTPAHDVLAYAVSYEHGIASRFINVDEDDPPTFESESAYLRTRDLLLPDEAERIPADAPEEEFIDATRILRLRPMAELEAEYAARKAAGTIGKHDPRFNK